jgi:acyl-CoA dehydrogenase
MLSAVKHIADPMIIETLDRLFTSLCDSACIAAVEQGEAAEPLWHALGEAGIPRAWVPESHGGSAATLADVCAIARMAGQHAAPVPLADHMLAAHLAACHDLPIGDGILALAPPPSTHDTLSITRGRIDGQRHRVPFARWASAILVPIREADGEQLALIDPRSVTITQAKSLCGEPLDHLSFSKVSPLAMAPFSGDLAGEGLLLAGACLRAQMMSGALAQVLSMSAQYAQERVAFGRPIAKFQAVQHNLAMLAGEVAAATAAANGAMIAGAEHGFADPRTLLAVASAKVRAGEAANSGAAIAHQVHGAMGYTQEHRLHQFTRRLWSWRDEYGQESEWAIRLGRVVAGAGPEALWASLTAL